MLKEEMIAMMTKAFEGQKLASGFTFKVLEAIKHIKINPMSNTNGVPWGISLAMGLVFVLLGLNPEIITLSQSNSVFNTLSSEAKVLEFAEIPANITRISEIANLKNGLGNDGNGMQIMPDVQNALFMAPQAEGGKWERKADMPNARGQSGAVAVNGKIYVVGGVEIVNGNFVQLSTTEEYDPIKDKWTKKANMPTARFLNYSVCEANGIIYAVGGFFGLPIVEAYDPITDKWTKKADLPTPRTHMCSAEANGKIYAMGGFRPDMKLVPTVEEYDPVNDVWTKKSDMPDARESASAVTIKNKIYVVGGDFTDNPNGWGPPIPKVWEYDPLTDKWTIKKSDMPTPRTGASAVVVDNKIYVINGFNGGQAFSVVEIYDPLNDIWTKCVDTITAKSFPVSCAVDGKIYVIGGFIGGAAPSPTVEEYDTGFRDTKKFVSPGEKLPSTWGQQKEK
ncbi:TPA: hypothetical protein ENS27_12160 [bacterium]|nr:hypothetical protein [bacterium]